jgi:hypothetical protein
MGSAGVGVIVPKLCPNLARTIPALRRNYARASREPHAKHAQSARSPIPPDPKPTQTNSACCPRVVGWLSARQLKITLQVEPEVHADEGAA